MANVSSIVDGLRRSERKQIPFYLLYDHRGSELYKKITELKSYYPFEAEKALFQKHALDIAGQIAPGSLIVELGCGVADKTALLLNAILSKHQRCHYVGIDVSRAALDEAETSMEKSDDLELELVHADYLEGLEMVRKKYPDRLICILWLGSSIGNLSQSESGDFVGRMLKIVGFRCQFFLCVDLWKDEATLRAAYEDKQGVTGSFIKNGMKHGLELLGHSVSDDEVHEDWEYEVQINSMSRQVEMYVRFLRSLCLVDHDIEISKNERVLVEISRKFTVEDVLQLVSQLGFVCHARWTSKSYGCFMMLSCEEAAIRCWTDTDKLFKGVGDWMSQPIPYRHPYCFYYGHVTAFTIIKLLKDESDTGLNRVFSRGIDPFMLDPSRCHKHPETPAQWPDKETLRKYTMDGRARVLEYLRDGNPDMRRLCLVLEHERMHQETMAYMLAQERKLQFEAPVLTSPHELGLADGNGTSKPAATDVFFTRGTVVLGSDPIPSVFRFDNEEPSYKTQVEHDFCISSMPVSIGEFMVFVQDGCYNKRELWQEDDFTFLERSGHKFPATWSCSQGDYYVHFPDKTLSWIEARHQPVYVSLMEAEAFSKWMCSRVMTEVEYQRVLDEEFAREEQRVKHLKDGGWEWTSSLLAPFEGFTSMEEYPEYSTDFFDGLHYVLKGSSPATHVSLLRDSFRNFYQRQYPYAFAKFRLCKSSQ
ncbi:hypothetical protein SELMODRAFT_441187 [Selaginella moellendorffii]|uniref:Methyltransferase domain-containing protein n=1 Tax=Selaginella moellendorffii TaxID=88036 RepID=D8RH58_SELML|nr:ergothioneine biosynthesis protein 1 [Selaginella moellendorffii]EFJ28475.1 hypothetical protein SELMODRAFT_441187 [Selaginella moellendorffii]|eukprot:XP_002970345.1 ergothioneine biosynthesis protein 1 [Selaginella moellendorffii]